MRTVEDICRECGKKISDVKAIEYDDSGLMIKRVEFYTPGDYMPSLGGGIPWNPVPISPQPPVPPYPGTPYVPPYQPVWMKPETPLGNPEWTTTCKLDLDSDIPF